MTRAGRVEHLNMSNYASKLESFLLRTRPRLRATRDLHLKPFFGAVIGTLNGRVFISCGRFGIALRLPPATLNALFQRSGAKPLRYFPGGHVKKEYAVLPKSVLDDDRECKKLVNASIRYALSLD